MHGEIGQKTRTAKAYWESAAIGLGLITGQRFYTIFHAGQSHSTVAQVYDTIRVIPVIFPVSVHILNIGCEVVTASTDTGPVVFRIGVWDDNGFFYPKNLLLDLGTGINGKSNTSQQVACNLQLPPGVYWMGGVPQSSSGTSAPPQLRSLSTIPYNITLGTTQPSNGSQYPGFAYNLGGGSGALPAQWTTTRSLSAIGCPRIYVQIA